MNYTVDKLSTYETSVPSAESNIGPAISLLQLDSGAGFMWYVVAWIPVNWIPGRRLNDEENCLSIMLTHDRCQMSVCRGLVPRSYLGPYR